MTERNWSVPETEVLQRIRDRLDGESADVLATIVAVEGSAYRRPGAKMLIEEAGVGVGSITAGCLEDELIAAAESVRQSGRPALITYDLMDDEDDIWGLGIGCNGVLDVLLEPLDDTYRPAVDAIDAGRNIAVLTIVDGDDEGDTSDGNNSDDASAGSSGSLRRGSRAYYAPEQKRLLTPAGDPATDWPESLASPAAELAERGKADLIDISIEGEQRSVFVDGLKPPTELVVFGSGHDVVPVTELGVKSDFRVTVVGFRGGVDLASRFPAAHETITASPGAVGDELDLGERTHAVVMSHNFIDDRLTVETLVDAEVPYIGLMGPHKRFANMCEEFEAEGRTFSEAELATLYTPIGLDLGGGSPYQIAHSIVAEVLAVSNGRTPSHLRQREGHIHDRVSVDAEERTPPQ